MVKIPGVSNSPIDKKISQLRLLDNSSQHTPIPSQNGESHKDEVVPTEPVSEPEAPVIPEVSAPKKPVVKRGGISVTARKVGTRKPLPPRKKSTIKVATRTPKKKCK